MFNLLQATFPSHPTSRLLASPKSLWTSTTPHWTCIPMTPLRRWRRSGWSCRTQTWRTGSPLAKWTQPSTSHQNLTILWQRSREGNLTQPNQLFSRHSESTFCTKHLETLMQLHSKHIWYVVIFSIFNSQRSHVGMRIHNLLICAFSTTTELWRNDKEPFLMWFEG